MNETRSTKIPFVIEVLIIVIYLNVSWDNKNKADTIGEAGVAMAAPVFVEEKWWSLEFIVMTMRACPPGPASKASFCLGSQLIISVGESLQPMQTEW